MTAFVTDTFTDTNGTAITSHTGELGATWTVWTPYNSATTPNIITSNQLISNEIDTGGCYYASGTPASADYTVSANIVYTTASPHDAELDAVMGRASTGASTCYVAWLSNGIVTLKKMIAGTLTLLSDINVYSSLTNDTYTLLLSLSGSTIGVKFKRASDGYWLDGFNTWVVGESFCLGVTDTSITSAGVVGLWKIQINNLINTSVFDSFSADETAPVIDLNGTITLDNAVASGTISGSNIGNLSSTITLEDAAGTGTIAGTSATGTLVIPALKNNTGQVLANEIGLTVYVKTTADVLVVTKTAQTTNSSGVPTVTDSLIVAGTTYMVRVKTSISDNGWNQVVAT